MKYHIEKNTVRLQGRKAMTRHDEIRRSYRELGESGNLFPIGKR